ncbi:hypothetical protein PC112_g22901 [Phytophthora cactorum]|nr:hypothetical protein PC112_g22901 [Phytophthora cactorum]
MLELSAADFADQVICCRPGHRRLAKGCGLCPLSTSSQCSLTGSTSAGSASGPSTSVSDGNKRVYFCDRVRPKHYPGNTLTCHQIWHIKWNNGKDRPRPLVGRDIQMRGLGKKRRHTSESEGEGESCKDGEDDDQAAGE